jgi:hypothetical protein
MFGPVQLTNLTAPYILYWDGARMQVGQYTDGATDYVYNGGNYWSSRPCDTTDGLLMSFGSSVYPRSYDSAQSGSTIRCVPQ